MREYKSKNIFASLKHVLWREMTFQIHFILFFVILYFANIFNIAKTEWLVLIIMFTIVICLEMLKVLANELCDLYSLDKHLHVSLIRDIASGAVLLASISFLIIVTIIFLPYLNF